MMVNDSHTEELVKELRGSSPSSTETESRPRKEFLTDSIIQRRTQEKKTESRYH